MTSRFSVPRIYEGETAVCIASGPSLSDADVAFVREMQKAGKCRVFVCNNNYLKAPDADVLFFCDYTFWVWHASKPEFQAFKGTKITMSTDIGTEPDINVIGIDAPEGLSFEADRLRTGGNSGYMQVNLAFLYGCKRVLLLGYEMQPKRIVDVDGKETIRTHWFGSHPAPTSPAWFPQVVGYFETMIPDLERAGLQVINCSEPSAINCFPKSNIREELK